MRGWSPIIVILPRLSSQHWSILHSLDLRREDRDQKFHKCPCQFGIRPLSPHSQRCLMGCVAHHPSKHACKGNLVILHEKSFVPLFLALKGNLVILHAHRTCVVDEGEPEVQRSVLELRDHVRHGERPMRGGGLRLRPHLVRLVAQFLH